ncbi:hypothetical protein VTK73DRAFT_5730 [Phialemonium thermophilum]|uniref:DUF3592 domain-containing protein n=1 Tax=Phialemonium thermophilum TaxID=223376 RepID=A0ABR3XXW6_9PEZI
MASRSTSPSGSGKRDGLFTEQSLIYKTIMTPVIFFTFIISLALVDYRYSVKRSQYHAERPSRLPRWLHRIIYRYQPYEYVVVDEKGEPTGQKPSPYYYHRKQQKLMKMEAADAFELRGTVSVALSVLGVISLWGLWRLFSWLWQRVVAG